MIGHCGLAWAISHPFAVGSAITAPYPAHARGHHHGPQEFRLLYRGVRLRVRRRGGKLPPGTRAPMAFSESPISAGA